MGSRSRTSSGIGRPSISSVQYVPSSSRCNAISTPCRSRSTASRSRSSSVERRRQSSSIAGSAGASGMSTHAEATARHLDGPRWRRSGDVRSPSVRTVTSTAMRRQRWRNLPVALAMLAPSLVMLVTFVLYPLGKAIWLGHQRCDIQGEQLPVERVGPVLGRVPQRRVPERPARHHQVRADHGAARSGARRRTGGARRQVAARGRPVPRRVLVDGGHVGRGRQPDVAVPAPARDRRAVQRRVDQRPVPRRQEPGSAARPGDGAGVGRDVERVGEPRLHVHPRDRRRCRASRRTCTRRRRSTVRAARAASGR